MTAKAALCVHLLRGEVLNIKNVFYLTGLSNAPREISRMIEKQFNVTVGRTLRHGKSRYGQPIIWYDFRLNPTEYNKDGIEKMKEYVQKQKGSFIPKTDKQLKQISLI
jgi:hypothetical protein